MTASHNWRTRTEREEAQKRQRIAIYYAMKERESAKPARVTTHDTDIWKRRDRS